MNKKILHIVDSDAAKERVFQLINSSSELKAGESASISKAI